MKFESSRNSFEDATNASNARLSVLIIPLMVISSIIPLLIHSHIYNTNLTDYTWYHGDSEVVDFFLYYKQWGLVVLGIIMILVILKKIGIDRKRIAYKPIFLPLIVYIIVALLSSVVSEYSEFAFSGLYSQFENIFALITYCVIVFYAYVFIQTENDLKNVTYALIISAIILSILGIFQFFSHDLLKIPFLQKLYLSDSIYQDRESLTNMFESNRVYLTMFNSNYVGVYTSMLIPLLICLIYFSKKMWSTVLYIATLFGMLICLIGSKSKAGIIAVLLSVIFIIVLLRKQLVKKWYISIAGILGIIIVAVAMIHPKSPLYSIDVGKLFATNSAESKRLEEIHTDINGAYITYKGNTLHMMMLGDASGFQGFAALDGEGNSVEILLKEDGSYFYTNDERFRGFTFIPVNLGGVLGFGIVIDGKTWYFTNQLDDTGNYHYVNSFLQVDEIKTAESALFTNNESFASGRGFIWSRTIPLLRNTILFGIGANSFAFVFPHTDYVGYYNNGFDNQMLTKAHSWYLKMGVETGVVSVICMLIFYMMYFVSSIKIYWKNSFEHFSSCLGVAIFIATTSYMIMGITNDSSITVAPVFWVLIGTGIAINYKFHRVSKKVV